MNIVDIQRQTAFCTSCKADVMVLPDLVCPRCGDPVHPLSLERVPGTEDRPTVLLATVPERPAVQAAPARTAETVKPTSTEPTKVTLPGIDEVTRWHAETARLQARLVADEARLVADLRGVRQLRKLLDHTLGLIEPPTPEKRPLVLASDVARDMYGDRAINPAPIVMIRPEPETLVGPQVTIATDVAEAPQVVAAIAPLSETPRAAGRFALGPEHPDYVPPASEGTDDRPWSTSYAACVDCGETKRPHMAKGRCRGCYAPWIKAGRP